MKSSSTQTTLTHTVITTALLLVLALALPFSASAATIKAKKAVDATCMQTAIGVREAAIMEAFVTFNEAIVEGLTDRKDALNDAWGLSDTTARNTAVKNAWATWKTTKKEAHADLKSERKAAWSTFKTTAKTSCKMTTPKEEALEKDSAGTVSL